MMLQELCQVLRYNISPNNQELIYSLVRDT